MMFRPRSLPGIPATRTLLAINVAIFALQWLAGPAWMPVVHFGGLTAAGLEHGELWQLVTYQFLHGNFLHLFVNMVALWFAGRELERVLGAERFLAVYFVGGVVGGLVQVGIDPGGYPLIGASGSVCAVLLALTTMFPRTPIMALIFFVLPVRMRAGTLGWLMVGASVAFWLSGLQPDVGHLAHLGGFAAGWVFGRFYRAKWGQAPLPDDDNPDQGPEATDLDTVLAKVLRHGMESLSSRERRVLEESRAPRRRG